MTTIRECVDAVHAGLLLSFLEDNEIDAVLADEDASAWVEARFLVPIRLQVADEQVDRAVALLKEFEAAPAVPEAEWGVDCGGEFAT